MKTIVDEMTISESFEYIDCHYMYFIGTTEILDDRIGRPGIWLNFYKPDRKIFIHIVGQKNRDNFVDNVYNKVNLIFEHNNSL